MKQLLQFNTKEHRLGYDAMDDIHQEFVDLYNSVDIKNNNSFKDAIIKLIHHTKHHFDEEERLMDLYQYPRQKEHKEEHQKVLNEMDYFLEISRSLFGLRMLKSYYLQKLPDWFHVHLISMDSDLAAFLKNNLVKTVN